MLVLVIFGSIVLDRSRTSMAQTLYNELEDSTRNLAVLVALNLERAMAVKDYLCVKLLLDATKQADTNIE